jgi:hypothetical protein
MAAQEWVCMSLIFDVEEVHINIFGIIGYFEVRWLDFMTVKFYTITLNSDFNENTAICGVEFVKFIIDNLYFFNLLWQLNLANSGDYCFFP